MCRRRTSVAKEQQMNIFSGVACICALVLGTEECPRICAKSQLPSELITSPLIKSKPISCSRPFLPTLCSGSCIFGSIVPFAPLGLWISRFCQCVGLTFLPTATWGSSHVRHELFTLIVDFAMSPGLSRKSMHILDFCMHFYIYDCRRWYIFVTNELIQIDDDTKRESL